MDFFLILKSAHSIVRWVIVLVALVAVVKFALGWLQKAKVEKNDRALMSAFSGLVDLQALLGAILLFGQGLTNSTIGFPPNRIEHAVAMTVVAVIAHLPAMWQKDATATALRNNLLAVVAALALVFVGVSTLGGNRWF
jgi:uncharacterized membrane protein YozB (DUF420 family)